MKVVLTALLLIACFIQNSAAQVTSQTKSAATKLPPASEANATEGDVYLVDEHCVLDNIHKCVAIDNGSLSVASVGKAKPLAQLERCNNAQFQNTLTIGPEATKVAIPYPHLRANFPGVRGLVTDRNGTVSTVCVAFGGNPEDAYAVAYDRCRRFVLANSGNTGLKCLRKHPGNLTQDTLNRLINEALPRIIDPARSATGTEPKPSAKVQKAPAQVQKK